MSPKIFHRFARFHLNLSLSSLSNRDPQNIVNNNLTTQDLGFRTSQSSPIQAIHNSTTSSNGTLQNDEKFSDSYDKVISKYTYRTTYRKEFSPDKLKMNPILNPEVEEKTYFKKRTSLTQYTDEFLRSRILYDPAYAGDCSQIKELPKTLKKHGTI